MIVACCQTEDIQDDIPASLTTIQTLAQNAQQQKADLICFPECFLQGYTRDEWLAKKRALQIDSDEFTSILKILSSLSITLILGMIERYEGTLYNTALTIQSGKILGRYRKNHVNETIFTAGQEQCIVTIDQKRIGVNICYDANFPETAQKLKEKQVDVIVYLLNNALPIEVANRWRHKHLENLSMRARETNAWILSSDIIRQDSECIGYGCTAIVNPQGKTVKRIAELKTGLLLELIE